VTSHQTHQQKQQQELSLRVADDAHYLSVKPFTENLSGTVQRVINVILQFPAPA